MNRIESTKFTNEKITRAWYKITIRKYKDYNFLKRKFAWYYDYYWNYSKYICGDFSKDISKVVSPEEFKKCKYCMV